MEMKATGFRIKLLTSWSDLGTWHSKRLYCYDLEMRNTFLAFQHCQLNPISLWVTRSPTRDIQRKYYKTGWHKRQMKFWMWTEAIQWIGRERTKAIWSSESNGYRRVRAVPWVALVSFLIVPTKNPFVKPKIKNLLEYNLSIIWNITTGNIYITTIIFVLEKSTIMTFSTILENLHSVLAQNENASYRGFRY